MHARPATRVMRALSMNFHNDSLVPEAKTDSHTTWNFLNGSLIDGRTTKVRWTKEALARRRRRSTLVLRRLIKR